MTTRHQLHAHRQQRRCKASWGPPPGGSSHAWVALQPVPSHLKPAEHAAATVDTLSVHVRSMPGTQDPFYNNLLSRRRPIQRLCTLQPPAYVRGAKRNSHARRRALPCDGMHMRRCDHSVSCGLLQSLQRRHRQAWVPRYRNQGGGGWHMHAGCLQEDLAGPPNSLEWALLPHETCMHAHTGRAESMAMLVGMSALHSTLHWC